MRGTQDFAYVVFVGLYDEPQEDEFVSLLKARLTSMRRIDIRTVVFGSLGRPYSEEE
ncbi:hypothetical protein ACVWZ4_001282 [Bradyrhizobium sp. USDA 4472]